MAFLFYSFTSDTVYSGLFNIGGSSYYYAIKSVSTQMNNVIVSNTKL